MDTKQINFHYNWRFWLRFLIVLIVAPTPMLRGFAGNNINLFDIAISVIMLGFLFYYLILLMVKKVFIGERIIVQRYFLQDMLLNPEDIVSINKDWISFSTGPTLQLRDVSNSEEVLTSVAAACKISNNDALRAILHDRHAIVYVSEDKCKKYAPQHSDMQQRQVRLIFYGFLAIVLGSFIYIMFNKQWRITEVIAGVAFLSLAPFSMRLLRTRNAKGFSWLIDNIWNLLVVIVCIILSGGLAYAVYRICLLMGYDLRIYRI